MMKTITNETDDRPNYLILSPDEFIAFKARLKECHSLVIAEQPSKIEIDKSHFGWIAWKETYSFSSIKDGKKKLITIQNGNGKVLYAVNNYQYKYWRKQKIVSEPFRWNFGRIISCIVQLAHKYDLVCPTKDLYQINQFLRKVINWRKRNG